MPRYILIAYCGEKRIGSGTGKAGTLAAVTKEKVQWEAHIKPLNRYRAAQGQSLYTYEIEAHA